MLEVKDLSIEFHDRGVREKVVSHVSFSMDQGEILGIVGESGSGKTMTALTIAGLLKSHAEIPGGEILFAGSDLLKLDEKERRKIKGKDISMIFQEPMTALNPTMKIGKQVEETLRIHTDLKKKERMERAYQALTDAELAHPEEIYHKYPHELSGGMRQRVMIAAAVIQRPKLLIADEPTTALDVYTQEQILKLLGKLNKKYEMGILFISHNLRVVKELCSRVIVMKEGKIIETGTADIVFQHPKETYTKELVAAIPTRTKNNRYQELIKRRAEGYDE